MSKKQSKSKSIREVVQRQITSTLTDNLDYVPTNGVVDGWR